MTLCTHIVIGQPVDTTALFDYCRDMLGAQPEHVPKTRSENGITTVYNPCGVGLPAWLWMRYGQDGPYQTPASWAEEWGDYDGDIPPYPHPWDVLIDLSFDTSYGYRDDLGRGCTDLHRDLVNDVIDWLEDHCIARWRWQNEFTGEWFDERPTFATLS